ncbi:MAG: DUF2791 family P-loop domain-containing protein [Ardenticatenales bacterium]|nr:DUF2791 family P-loop domain-containing protein [Ardenticatenales bacterium]
MSSRYILHNVLGRGGMGVVYESTDRLTGETVAYKQVTVSTNQLRVTPRPLSETIMELRLALANEFRILASLRHPNIISVLDYGFDQMGQPFYTMAYLQDAHPITEPIETPSTDERIELLRQLLQAMVYLHHRGILHRDLKPANVLVENGRVRVLDFGLAVLKGQDAGSVGSWSYVAPEIVYGKPASELSDLYAVGVMAYELFAGRHPFDVESPFFMEQILSEPPSFEHVEAPAEINEFLAQLLAKEPADRFASAGIALQTLNNITGQYALAEDEAVRDSFLQSAAFIGRKEEMEQLTAALERARHGNGSFWLLGGESGVGKTRLLNEIRTRALVEGGLVTYSQSSEDKGLPYQLWHRVIQRLALHVDLDELSASVLQTIVPNLELLIGKPISPPPSLDTEAAQQRLISAVSDLFLHQQGWLLLILEDLQWADESLEILEQLGRLASSLPLLIVGSYRNDDRPDLPERFPDAHTILLDRFNSQETAELSEAMLGTAGSQENVLDLLQRETEGNAFFIVEVVRALAEQAGRLSAIGQMALPRRLFPQRIASIVQQRLARLPAHATELLPAVAIAGRDLDLALIDAITRAAEIKINLESWLSQCASAAVLEISDGTWRFAHDKIREGVLESISDDAKVAWHLKVATAIEQLYPDNPAYAARLADHWQVIGDPEKEKQYARNAGHYAVQQFAHENGLYYLNRAIGLTGDDEPALLYELLLAREGVYHLRGERDEQMADLIRLGKVADLLAKDGSPNHLPESALRLANFAETTGDYDAAAAAALEAHRLAVEGGSEELQAASQLTLGQAYLRQGNFPEAKQVLQQGMAGARNSRSTKIEADCYRFLGVAASEQRQFDQCTAYYRQALRLYRIINDKQGESAVLNNLGIIKVQDHVAEGLVYWKQASTIFQEIGDRLGMARVLTNLSNIYTDLGEYETAMNYGQQALQLSREINVPIGVCFNLLNLSLTQLHLGEHRRADQLSSQALKNVRAIGVRPLEASVLRDRGYILRQQNRFAEADRYWQEALALSRELEMGSIAAEVQAEIAFLAQEEGKLEKAGVALAEVMKAIDDPAIIDAAARPFRLYLVTIGLLRQQNDARASHLLQTAYEGLMAKAAQISNEALRHSFLTRVAAHRAIIQLYQTNNPQ